MIQQDYIDKYKKDGLTLVKHLTATGKDGTPIFEYVKKDAVHSFVGSGLWVTVIDVPIPVEYMDIPTIERKEDIKIEITKPIVKRGRKSKQ